MCPGIADRVVMPLFLHGTPGTAASPGIITVTTTSREASVVILLITATIGIGHGTGTAWLTGIGTGVLWFYRLTDPMGFPPPSTARPDLTMGRLTTHFDGPADGGILQNMHLAGR
jgi:hypothetical protein